jgi:pimeloyl-ACP methyl ester carboxylesterase
LAGFGVQWLGGVGRNALRAAMVDAWSAMKAQEEYMSKRMRSWLFLGAALGALTAFIWRSRQRSQALARQIHDIMPRAIQKLGAPAMSIFLSGDGVELHAVTAGPEDGPLALLLHGFPECWYSWRHQIPVLVEAGYRVVVPDQRGYNLSDKPAGIDAYRIDCLTADILALIRALGRDRATIIGHDWGGFVAWRLSMDHPEAVERLVVMNAPHPVAFAKALRSDWSQRLRSWYMFVFQLPWFPETLLGLWPRTSARLFFQGTAVRREAFSDFDLKVMAAALAQPHALRSMIDWYRATFRTRPVRRVRPIEASTLLIWAENDVALGKPLTYGLEKWVPDLEIHYVPHCGHWVQNEAPQEVNECLKVFLQEPA